MPIEYIVQVLVSVMPKETEHKEKGKKDTITLWSLKRKKK